jgi:hypothetical protein
LRIWCWFHDPSIAEQRKQANKRGGRQPKKRLIIPAEAADFPLENLEDVQQAIADTANKVRKGELSTPVGHCLSQLFGQLVRVFRGDPEMTVNVKPALPQKTPAFPTSIRRAARRAGSSRRPLVALVYLLVKKAGSSICLFYISNERCIERAEKRRKRRKDAHPLLFP